VENFNSILYKKRLFYPRNFKLSVEFIDAFKKELKRLLGEGHSPKIILDKISKALIFHSKNS
jgi:hypothetical protein